MPEKVGRIESEIIYTELAKNDTAVKVVCGRNFFNVHIVSCDGKTLVVTRIRTSEKPLLFGRRATLFFSHRNKEYNASFRVKQESNQVITLDAISALCAGMDREHIRIHNIEDIKIRIQRKGGGAGRYPVTYAKSNASTPTRHNIYSQDINAALRALREYIHENGLEYKVILFRTQEATQVTELIMAHTGKPLLLPSIIDDSQLSSPQEIERAIQALNISDGHTLLKEQIATLQKNAIAFLCYVPLCFKKFCVGYILIIGRNDRKANEMSAIISHLVKTSTYLVHALEANNYFKDGDMEEAQIIDYGDDSRARIQDISLRGLKFNYLAFDNILAIKEWIIIWLYFGSENKLELEGEVTHIINRGRVYSVGVQFMNLSADNTRALHAALYKEADTIYEQTPSA